MVTRLFRSLIPSLIGAGLFAPGLVAAMPLEIVERASREGFPLERNFLDGGPESRRLEACGVYLRIRDGAKLYALCLYVDMPRLLSLTRGHARTPRLVADLLMGGKVSHAFISRFVQPIPRANRMAFLKGHLETYWPGGGFDPNAAGLSEFLGFFDRELKAGVETQVWIDEGGIIATRETGGSIQKTGNSRLCRAFTSSYFARQPMDLPMRDSLLKDIIKVLDVEDLTGQPMRPAKH